MPYLREALMKKKEELEMYIIQSEKQLLKLPSGCLHSKKNGKYYSYYMNDENNRNIYISTKEKEFIKQLSQRKYLEALLTELNKEYQLVIKQLKKYKPEKCVSIYEKLAPRYNMLIEPIIEPEDMYSSNWIKQKKKETMELASNSYEKSERFESANGEYLRSKSELIISEKLNRNNVPYIYEYPFKTETGKTLYPDFYILNKRTRKSYFYEHFGMMDNEEYVNNAITKIEEYERNGVKLGDKLLVTFETSKKGLNTKRVDEMIKNYFI